MRGDLVLTGPILSWGEHAFVSMLSLVTGTPHPFRVELIDRWSAFLDGHATDAETAQYVDLRLADYGPEELVHDGVLLLNDDRLAGRPGGSTATASWSRFDAWRQEVASFDADPARWNRNWAISYLERVLPGIKHERRGRFLDAMSDKLSEGDVVEIAERFDVA